MLRGCPLRLATIALLFIFFLPRYESLAFDEAGYCSPVFRNVASNGNFRPRFGQHVKHIESHGVRNLPNGFDVLASYRLSYGAIPCRQKQTSLAGLASKKNIEGSRGAGSLKKKRQNDDDRRKGVGLNIIPLGRRNRNQVQRKQGIRRGSNDSDEEFVEENEKSPSIILAKTTPRRGRWRRLRILRPRFRNGRDGVNCDAPNLRDQGVTSSSMNENRRREERRKNRKGQRKNSDTAKEKFSDSGEKSSDSSVASPAPLSPLSLGEESISIIPASVVGLSAADDGASEIDMIAGDSLEKSNANKSKTVETKRISSSPEDLHDDEKSNDSSKKKQKEKRVSFSATARSTRVLVLDDRSRALLTKYMTQPVEQYSVISFYGDADGDEETAADVGSVGGTQVSGRRWLIRRLTEKESAPYRSKENTINKNGNGLQNNFFATRKTNEDGAEESEDTGYRASDNFFRLAVPLMPLIGLDLTPVIDVEVIPPVSTSASVNTDLGEDEEDSVTKDSKNGRLIGSTNDSWRGGIIGRGSDDQDIVRIQSLRVSLLSTEEEVREIMSNKSPAPFRKQQAAKSKVTDPAATAVSKNENVRRMGYEAIGMVDKLAEWTQPYLSFESEITWNEGGNRTGKNDCSVTVKSTVATTLTIPPLPISFPLPTSLFVRKIGSTITKRVLALVLPRFLRLLESDFKRWASVDDVEKPTNE